MRERRKSIQIRIGDVTIGGNAPIRVQSMTKTDTRDIKATVGQIRELRDCGCEIIRIAIPDSEAAQALEKIKGESPLPIIADIHFDHRLALAALEAGADGIRLNPGNIHDRDEIAGIARSAKDHQVPIRVGINSGSLPPLGDDTSLTLTERMVKSALEYIRTLEDYGFNLIKVSLKSFDVPSTVSAYELIADKTPYPLHLGITEAGLARTGSIRSAVGIGILLNEGIGDTIRVSLTAPPQNEIEAAYEILKSLNIREHGPSLVSCPTCGRTEVDIIKLADAVNRQLSKIGQPIKVAVMGCIVNGPGEAMEADVGVACGKGRGAIFKKGKVIRTVAEKELLDSLMKEVSSLVSEKNRLP